MPEVKWFGLTGCAHTATENFSEQAIPLIDAGQEVAGRTCPFVCFALPSAVPSRALIWIKDHWTINRIARGSRPNHSAHWNGAMGSRYLWRPPRTLRMACRDSAATQPELAGRDCDACANGKLCAIYDRIERDRSAATEAACFEAPVPFTTMPVAETTTGKCRYDS
jgi:hypothetical protein